jgi:RNA polymerase sigma-70 factor (ECF subfamily)
VTERSNEEWLTALRQPGPTRDAALDDLRATLLNGLRYALADRAVVRGEDMEDFVQDALVKILAELDSFRGESRFTTWAQKITVRVAFSELRRRRWRDVSLDSMTETPTGGEFIPAELADPAPDSEEQTAQRLIVQTMRHVINHELTERQRQALVAIALNGVSLEVVAERLGTNRNALYKLLHDARQNLRRKMLDTGLAPEDILSAFDT